MADVNINLFKKIEENTTETGGFPEGYLLASVNGKVQGVDPNSIGGGGNIFIERSLPDLHTDISNDELVPGATYKVTGVHRAHMIDIVQIGEFPIKALYDDGRDLGTTIFLKAISVNELETFGSGIFYNPKYDKQVQGVGIWSNTVPSYNVDDIVFWGGYAWKNLNGNIGTDTDILNLDGEWEKLNYDDVNYNKVVDYIEYDIENDIITRRYDTVNEIDVSSGFIDIVITTTDIGIDFSSISLMQWGNVLDLSSGAGAKSISVKHMSLVELINFKGSLVNNVTFDNGSRLSNVTFDNGSGLSNVTFDKGSRLNNVTFDNGSRLSNVTFDKDSYLENVTFDNGSRLNNVTFDNSTIRYSIFLNFIANFNNQTYIDLNLSSIKFEGNGITYTMPDISLATLITDQFIPQKKVFGIDATTIKIQYWDSVSNDFVVAYITD